MQHAEKRAFVISSFLFFVAQLWRLNQLLYLVLEDQVLPQAAERLGEGEQSLVAERLPVVLHHHHSASQLRINNKVSAL